ncbi:hypothetical protein EVAR_19259_1 [Eumeta japonica]|uniref:Uncharacterized protein n=1 Tax=Eumeta variegata TaxID=151549 RepID=A0A4C1UD63_EUMVA|nr:hypothetical protein EVAR_19259_1 [Eumeta japonica]
MASSVHDDSVSYSLYDTILQCQRKRRKANEIIIVKSSPRPSDRSPAKMRHGANGDRFPIRKQRFVLDPLCRGNTEIDVNQTDAPATSDDSPGASG